MPEALARRTWRHWPRLNLSVRVLIVLVLVVGCGLGWVIRGRLKEAESAYRQARADRQVAEAALVEYRYGIYKQELETVKGEILLAEAERKRAEDRVVWSDRMFAKGSLSKAQNVADKMSLQQKIFVYEQAQTKLAVLKKYTKDKTIKGLQSEIDKARATEMARKAAYERLKSPRLALPW
jgi:hypothetical protein